MQDVCLFAHFDKDDRVDDYVWSYLVKLKALNFAIVLISTSRLPAGEIARLKSLCDDVIVRDNTGLDFASWSAGFAKHDAAIGGRLLLANDSVYGPIGSLDGALAKLTRTAADFYGMVESVEIAPHLQSWFILLQPQVVRSAAFRSIIGQPFAAMTRPQIVRAGEVGLSRQLMAAGFRFEALYRGGRAAGLPPRHDANPMLLYWREMLFAAGVPFLKIELLRDNPIGVEDASAILHEVERIDPQICGLIRSHLVRTAASGSARPQRAALARYRYALMRRYDRARNERRRLTGALTRIQLEMLAIPLAVWRRVRTPFG
jgi:lipopolysaccharide biosynthesis protein